MVEPVLWLGGWASGLECWRSELEQLYPHREHRFLDAHRVLAQPELLPAEAARLPAGGCLAAWSLGSLLLHRALADGLHPACRLLSISPVFSFCRTGGPWPRSAVRRMARRIAGERETVLAEFLTLVLGNLDATHKSRGDAWTMQAAAYSEDSLEKGLEHLAAETVDPMELPDNARHVFLASPLDPLAPAWQTELAGKRRVAYPHGHVPFLDYPETVAPLFLDMDPSAGALT